MWSLLGGVILPLWLLAGVADYVVHARTGIAYTSGVHESALHLLQTAEIGVPMLALLFLEATAPVLLLALAGVAAHTLTAYRDLRWAAPRRRITVFEQFVHAFLVVLPLAAFALVVLLHWTAWRALFPPYGGGLGDWGLRWRQPQFPLATLAAILSASMLLGVVPGVAEFGRTLSARRRGDAPPAG
ncbi:hypothetical protein MQC88_01390 [Luteimonas sp. 50]|uniref:Diguanylate cyclase n=1 Tax=Cognatiluteimonas sedimenti TaxID=2927791 RepID=A0ABT0A0X4_9GAMM|nr:hypothetical protein [Lysobacter sedimenti]MCJ0824626.1 hypothetical protein [Lysobacter sedimenti]